MCLGALALGLDTIAATRPAEAQTARLELADQTPYVAADGVFGVWLDWSGEVTEDLTVSATVFAALESEQAIDEPVGESINRYPAFERPISIGSLQRNDAGAFHFEIPIRSFSAADERVWLQGAGVYPVIIEIRQPDGPIASVRTQLIHLPTETAEITSLPMALVLNVASADGLELAEAAGVLSRHPSLPFTVVLEDGVLSQLLSDPELALAFRTALGDRPVTGVPALGLDPSALAAINQPNLYAIALEQTAERFNSVGLRADSSMVALDTSVTQAGAELLTDLGIDTVIDLAGSQVSGTGTIATSTSEQLVVVAADDQRALELRIGDGSVARAHQLLAALAIRFESEPTPIVLGGPELRLVDINALEVILRALDQPGLIEPVRLDTAVELSPTVPFRYAASASQDLRSSEASLSGVLERLETYRLFHAGGGTSPVLLERTLLASLSRDRNSADREEDLARVVTELEESLDVISLPERQSITLAARRRAIPLSINNVSGGDRSVLLRFTSDRIEVDEDEHIVIVPDGASSIEINVEARSLGVSPLDVRVFTPDGKRELTRTRFQIRSTAVPGLGYLLSGAALVFLVAWWIVSITRSRAMQQHPSAQATKPSTEDASDDRRATPVS